jgi:hypothetical protein
VKRIIFLTLIGFFYILIPPPASVSAFDLCKTSQGVEIKWFGSNIQYGVNPTGGPWDSLSAICSAANTWSNVNTANFDFLCNGSSLSPNPAQIDGKNEIGFASLTSMGDPSTVSENFFWYYVSSGQIIESDIILSSDYPWATNGSQSAFDLQSVATHELGHSLCLDDLYNSNDSNKIMYGYIGEGEIKRVLDQDSINGITYLYPGSVGYISATTTPANGHIFIDGTDKGKGPWNGYVLTGSHTVSFGSVLGYNKPAAQVQTVNLGQTVNISGTYTPFSNPVKIGIYRQGAWYFDNGYGGAWDGCFTDTCISAFGGFAADIPVTGDWAGIDGIKKIGIYRQGMWYLDLNNSGTWSGCGPDRCLGPFGGLGMDIPVVGDWNKDGRTKIGIYRQGYWYLDMNANGAWDGCSEDRCLGPFGGSDIDIPVTGDWNGNGIAKIGIYRQGMWYLDLDNSGTWSGCGPDSCLGPFGGLSIDIPIVGDWNKDSKSKVGIYRQGAWYLDMNGNGTWDGCETDLCNDTFGGVPGDAPILR